VTGCLPTWVYRHPALTFYLFYVEYSI
jgi:hypothetical protein